MFLRNKLNPTQEPHINITFFIKASKQSLYFSFLTNTEQLKLIQYSLAMISAKIVKPNNMLSLLVL